MKQIILTPLRWSGILVVLALLAFPMGCDDAPLGGDEPPDATAVETDELRAFAEAEASYGKGIGILKVMTRNVYVGTDVDAILSGAVSLEEAFNELMATNFPERAEALSREVARTRPHMIGLQEISKIDVTAGDFVFSLDFLPILMDALAREGQRYTIVGEVADADVTMGVPGFSARLQDFDVLLARHDVGIDNIAMANYQAKLVIDELGIVIPRGYVAADATIRGRTYRVVTTHLEPFYDFLPPEMQIQIYQAQELAATLQGTSLPVVLLGDFNMQAVDEPAGIALAYNVLVEAGYADAWTHNVLPFNREGPTCCQRSDLMNEVSELDRRFDQVWFKATKKKGLGLVFAVVLGDEQRDRTPSGLWPSDHGGVVALLVTR